jgi:hypothetical protein
MEPRRNPVNCHTNPVLIQRTARNGRELRMRMALTKTLCRERSSSKQRLDILLSPHRRSRPAGYETASSQLSRGPSAHGLDPWGRRSQQGADASRRRGGDRLRAVPERLYRLAGRRSGAPTQQINPLQYSPRHAAYDLNKLRGKHIVQRIARTCRYETLPTGLRAMTALIVLRNKAIKPLLAAARPLPPARGPHNPKPIDAHYQTIQGAMRGVFHELGLAA